MPGHVTAVTFRNYKTFRRYTVGLSGFNILVGPNNAGKSTVIGAFRILAEGLRRAHSRKAEYLDTVAHRGHGYRVDLSGLPISTENIFTDYDEAEPAKIEFEIVPGGKLTLIFPEPESCFLVADTGGRIPQTPSDFKRAFDFSLSFVPVLGPVEHNEQMFQIEAARNALLTHRASRNFRNIWYHYPANFPNFRSLIQQTWPGMDIKVPELSHESGVARLHMFYEEARVSREMFWAGFGFQAWCQMLTFVAKAPPGSLLIIDEPDVYLHSDLQRQLIHVLRARGGDTLIATHSTEMLSEAESGDIVVIDKKGRHAKRISKPLDLQNVFLSLGSSLNPILTQLAKTRRVLFVEGSDFTVIASFARRLGRHEIANQSGFAVVPAYGFNPARVRDFSDGMEATLGFPVKRAVIFDRDYRLVTEVDRIRAELSEIAELVRIHERKELENFVLVPSAIERCIQAKLKDRARRGAKEIKFDINIEILIDQISLDMKSMIFGQYNAKYSDQTRLLDRSLDQATINMRAHECFEKLWSSREERGKLIPGKKILAKLNEVIQESHSISISPVAIVSAMSMDEVPSEIRQLVEDLRTFCA